MPGMPYHLEKGPWLSILEDLLNGTADGAVDVLSRLRQGVDLVDLPFYDSPALDGDPDYDTAALRRAHLARDWFGRRWDDDRGGWAEQPTFLEEVAAALGTDLPAVGSAQDLERAVEGREDLDALVDWPTTGFWYQYHGDVHAVLREALVRTIEVALGLDHDAAVPSDGPSRHLPIELYWKCPQRWFEGWVTWRWDPDHGTGQVTTVLATPGSGKPILEIPTMGAGALAEPSSRLPDGFDGPLPRGPAPCEAGANAHQAPKGMWVVAQAEHARLGALDATRPSTSGSWRIPAFGATYVGVGPVVVVAPHEFDGGVDPAGRPWVDPPGVPTTTTEEAP